MDYVSPATLGRAIVYQATQNRQQNACLQEAVRVCRERLAQIPGYFANIPEGTHYDATTGKFSLVQQGTLVTGANTYEIRRKAETDAHNVFLQVFKSQGEEEQRHVVEFLNNKRYGKEGALEKFFGKIEAGTMKSPAQKENKPILGELAALEKKRGEWIQQYRECLGKPVVQTEGFQKEFVQIGQVCTDQIMRNYAAERQETMSANGKKKWQERLLPSWESARTQPRGKVQILFTENDLKDLEMPGGNAWDRRSLDERLVRRAFEYLLTLNSEPNAERILQNIQRLEEVIQEKRAQLQGAVLPCFVAFDPNAPEPVEKGDYEHPTLMHWVVSLCVDFCMSAVAWFKGCWNHFFGKSE